MAHSMSHQEGTYQQKDTSGDQFSYATGSETEQIAGKKHADVGLGSLTAGDFFNADGSSKTVDEIVTLLQPHKPGVSREALINQINDFMPKLRGMDKQQAAFLAQEKGIKGQERVLAMGKAEDVYGLSTRAAKRGLESSLGQAQGQAASLGGQMRGAYGGMGGGMRGAIGGQAALAKGVESTYGGYQDEMIGAQQQLGYAEKQYGVGGIGEQRAELTEAKGIYGLQEERRGEFEQDIGSFLQGFKGGGRVPSKESFLEILSKIPDAGGS